MKEENLQHWGGFFSPSAEVEIKAIDSETARAHLYDAWRPSVNYFKLMIRNPENNKWETPEGCEALTEDQIKKIIPEEE